MDWSQEADQWSYGLCSGNLSEHLLIRWWDLEWNVVVRALDRGGSQRNYWCLETVGVAVWQPACELPVGLGNERVVLVQP